MLSLQNLIQSTQKVKHNSLALRSPSQLLGFKWYPDRNELECSGTCRSSSDTNMYSVMILFHHTQVNPLSLVGSVEIPLNNSLSIRLRKLSMLTNTVQVRCSCPDYQFTWSYWNDKVGSLYGIYEPYVKKTTKRIERNPLHVPGLCKHLLSFVDTLKSANILQ